MNQEAQALAEERDEVLRQLDDRTNQTWVWKRQRWAALVRRQAAEIDRLAALHPDTDSSDGMNEWGGAECFSKAQSEEMSPEFTDTARDALLWVLWHHQGGSSPIGQPIRFALGVGAHDRLSEPQINRAKRWASLTKSTTDDFHRAHPAPVERVTLSDKQIDTIEAGDYIEAVLSAEDLRTFARAVIAEYERANGVEGA